MSIRQFLFACSVAVGTLVASPLAVIFGIAPAAAHTIVVTAPAPSFRHIEFIVPEDQRLPAAREAYARAIPVGSRVADARALLRHTGASCHRDKAAVMACTWSAFEPADDVVQDVVWTVAVAHDGDVVTGLAIDRNVY